MGFSDQRSIVDDFSLDICDSIIYRNLDYIFRIEKPCNIMLSDISNIIYIGEEKYRAIFHEDDQFIQISLYTLYGERVQNPFLDFFGYAKISITISEKEYVSSYITIADTKAHINPSINNMVNYIFNNCDDYLCEKHEKGKSKIGFSNQKNTSIDAKLSLLDDIVSLYTHYYSFFENSPQTKLIPKDEVGDFSKLQNITYKTIQYISTHSEELELVNYNTGIYYNGGFYQPKKTLIKTAHYSRNIYENQIVVSFLERIISDLTTMINYIENMTAHRRPLLDNDYIETMSIVYDKYQLLLSKYISHINKQISSLQRILYQYKKILPVASIVVNSRPDYTNVFRSILPYHHIYEKVIEWFDSSNYDMTKSDLMLSFISGSKIYEYYCLLKLLKVIETLGFEMTSSFPFFYQSGANPNSRYVNTRYNNTFTFKKDNTTLTLYYQPVIKLYEQSISQRSHENSIGLFRNTSVKIYSNESSHVNPYTPDYVLKIEKDGLGTRYYLLDAKLSTKVDVYNKTLSELVFKYLFSISTYNVKDEIAGLCVLCGKETSDRLLNIHDKVPNSMEIKPSAHCVILTGSDVDNYDYLTQWINYALQ